MSFPRHIHLEVHYSTQARLQTSLQGERSLQKDLRMQDHGSICFQPQNLNLGFNPRRLRVMGHFSEHHCMETKHLLLEPLQCMIREFYFVGTCCHTFFLNVRTTLVFALKVIEKLEVVLLC